jgi:hypothetical protein
MLKTVLLVTIAWTAMSFLFCVAWARLLHQPRALISRTRISIPGADTFTPWRESPPGPGRS